MCFTLGCLGVLPAAAGGSVSHRTHSPVTFKTALEGIEPKSATVVQNVAITKDGTKVVWSPKSVTGKALATGTPCGSPGRSFTMSNTTLNARSVTFDGSVAVRIPAEKVIFFCGYGAWAATLGLLGNAKASLKVTIT